MERHSRTRLVLRTHLHFFPMYGARSPANALKRRDQAGVLEVQVDERAVERQPATDATRPRSPVTAALDALGDRPQVKPGQLQADWCPCTGADTAGIDAQRAIEIGLGAKPQDPVPGSNGAPAKALTDAG